MQLHIRFYAFLSRCRKEKRIRFLGSRWSGSEKCLFFVYSESHFTSKACPIQ